MFVQMKKCASLLLTFVLLCSLGGAALAADDSVMVNSVESPLVLRWTNTTSVDVNLSITAGSGVCSARVIGKAGTTSISATVKLKRKNSNGTYTTVKTWNNLENSGTRLLFDEVYYVTTGHTYRLTITATVYRNGTGETVTGYHEAYAG